MKLYIFLLYHIVFFVENNLAIKCGCKSLTKCYEIMLEKLHSNDEAHCIEESPTGTGTMMVYLKALTEFCGEYVKVNIESYSYGEKPLYEVEVSAPECQNDTNVPIIILEAGQDGGVEATELALFTLQQLVACRENLEMITKVRWIILPCSNPDGMEYSRINKFWRKNYRNLDDGMSIGVDISRNFESYWSSCAKCSNGFSSYYPGQEPNSENETKFVTEVLKKHKSNTKIYVSIKRNGHYIGYPYAYAPQDISGVNGLTKVAAEVAIRVNQRAGSVQVFLNDSIYSITGKPHCGHSVDFAHDLGIPLSYEMRVYLAKANAIISMFHSPPRGYESTLRNGYYSGIREFYNAIVNEKKYGKLFES